MAKQKSCEHEHIEVTSRCPDCGKELGRAEFNRSQLAQRGLSPQEMAAQGGTELPNREAMSLVNANAALPINAALALNVLSDGSIAYAGADQYAPISQGIGAPPVTSP